MEVIDIDFNNLEPIKMNFNNNSDNENMESMGSILGPGIELLMNDKKKSSNSNVNIDLGELDDLEKELNNLSKKNNEGGSGNSGGFSGATKTFNDFTSNLFGFGSSKNTPYTTEHESGIKDEYSSNLGQATKDTAGNTKTWDGFSKMNEMESSFSNANIPKMNEREKRRKKRLMIKKLEEWYEKGLIKNITHFNADSSFEDVEDEYETALEDKRKKDSIKLQGWWFMTFVNSVEYANAAFNPFDLNLDGWGEQISEDIDSYEEIFSELHEKYKGGKMAPELSLLLRIGFSAAIVNFTNKALSTATPGFNDVIKQSPELMKMFTNATVNSMSQQSPGFAFASNLINQPHQTNTSYGPPPPPMETKNQPHSSQPPRPGTSMNFTQSPPTGFQAQQNVRPDIQMARGSMLREPGINISNNYTNINERPQKIPTPSPAIPPTLQRPEMKGPQNVNLDNILSGLKTKPVNLPSQTTENSFLSDRSVNEQIKNNYSENNRQDNPLSFIEEIIDMDSLASTGARPIEVNNFSQNNDRQDNNDSMISISSLKSLQTNNQPKRGRRKNRSDRNTISLDI
jgi:hypothetical protein